VTRDRRSLGRLYAESRAGRRAGPGRHTWGRERAEADDFGLVVRCQGRRILGIRHGIVGDEWWPAIDWLKAGDPNPFVVSIGRDGPEPTRTRWGFSCRCPNHRDGHSIDEERLADAVTRLCRPGKVASIDIREVERAPRADDSL